MKLFIKYRIRILQITNFFIYLDNYSVSYYFSRFGNNLQQIALGILYTQKVGGNYYNKDHPRVQNFSIINKPVSNYFSLLKQHYRFFYFKDQKDFPLNKVDTNYILENIEETFKHFIRPNINFLEELTVPEDTLVIHIRSGDIFDIPITSYFQNPINYYQKLIENYEKVILVTSEEKNNPVIGKLLKESNVTLHSSSVEQDFNLLVNAVNLATSGVGTFPIAAALLSKKLKNFYYTNLFSEEHLNPQMILDKKVTHHQYTVQESYKKDYLNKKNPTSLILDDGVKVYKN
tara:strand:+ start:484 stop:1350 length:867 start_codon:yes stop_codon:yes gene_type:complete